MAVEEPVYVVTYCADCGEPICAVPIEDDDGNPCSGAPWAPAIKWGWVALDSHREKCPGRSA